MPGDIALAQLRESPVVHRASPSQWRVATPPPHSFACLGERVSLRLRRQRRVEELAYIGQTGVVAVEHILDRTICIGQVTYEDGKAELR